MTRFPDRTDRLMIRCAVCKKHADDVYWRENEHDMTLVRQLRGQVGVAFAPEPPGPPQLPINQPRP